jgi:hypothetical protein
MGAGGEASAPRKQMFLLERIFILANKKVFNKFI